MTFRDNAKLSDNWRFSDDNIPVNSETLEFYIDKYGVERALGYIEAIADVRAEASWMLDHWNPASGGYTRSASKTQVMLRQFEKHKEKLVEFAVNHPVTKLDDALIVKLKQK